MKRGGYEEKERGGDKEGDKYNQQGGGEATVDKMQTKPQ